MTIDPSGEGPPSLKESPWLVRPETRNVLEAIEHGNHCVRVVGGAVRNALLGETVRDVDVATTARPEEVIRLAEAASLRAIPTGIEHGTVTIVSSRVPIEVTTLRRDTETYGRHAKVTYTTSWTEDAQRRDFTMNALYCDADGTVYDPLNGYADLVARRVRFIGHPQDRIREDYLRILRFLRLTAEYGQGALEPQGLAACVELKNGLNELSGERIRTELLRLLAAPYAAETVTAGAPSGILDLALGHPANTNLLARTIAVEDTLDQPADGLLRLAALAAVAPGQALSLRERLKLSNKEFESLARTALPDKAFDPKTPEREAKSFIYRHGADAFRRGAILDWTRSGEPTDDPKRLQRTSLPDRWQAPQLPVRGADVIALAPLEGPAIGQIIRAFEDWWIEHDFPADPTFLSVKLARLVKDATG
jgi:poly(A) polymerase